MDKQLEKIRHSTAHILAFAVKKLYPSAKLAIGPAIKDGFYYDFDNLEISEKDLKKIEKKMKKLIKQNLKFSKKNPTKAEAKKLLKGEKYKLDLLKDLKKPSFYSVGDFQDLCAGPHVKSTKEIPAFKLTKIAGAYWKGESKNKMLTRIYGTAFKSPKELANHLEFLKEAELRNHIKLGKELDLFSIQKEGPGFPFFHPKGMIVWNELLKYWREEHSKENYLEVSTPLMLNRELWETSGHWENYKQNMYFTKIDKEDFAIKPMNCPGGILIYRNDLHSYRELPLKVAELGQVHRHELSGVLNGLFRVRMFTQDDAHVYCTEAQIKDEVVKIIKLIDRMYKTFGLDYHMELSTRPKKSIGTDKMWKTAEASLKGALKKIKAKYELNPRDGAFYGPKIDFHIKDSLGRTWQCGTIQLDFALPERFDLTYEGQDNKKHRPVMLHRVVYGAIERFFGILIEHYAGKFPLWLAPTQIRILTVSDKNKAFANKIKKELEKNKLRVELDDKSESIGKKVRNAQVSKVPQIITIGDKEQSSKTLAVRTLDGKIKFKVKIPSFIKDLTKQIEKRC
ncbi:MAG: threonine--tRNA ligase [Nanoarchaeota archaeon]|jgi:threonyl-tRNA synthetase|nr:threonine--tRNA ligase [Nanoarchaeota archaeon]|tara:strand:- start:13181 stop:14878 length:1698 start_codon:yes stop_codon:yes gene_type:complete